MPTRALDLLVQHGWFLESPRWHEGEWWVSDIYGCEVIAVDRAGVVRSVVTVPGRPSGIGWLPDGRAVVVSMRDQLVLVASGSGFDVLADLSELARGPLNDLATSAAGYVYVGDLGFDYTLGGDAVPTSMIVVSGDGSFAHTGSPVEFPNGSVVLSTGELIVAETRSHRLTAFPIDADGTLGEGRLWADLRDTSVGMASPDGIGVDAEDRIWMADSTGGRCLLVAQGGAVTDVVDLPDGLGAYGCTLGGTDGHELLIGAAVRDRASRRPGDAMLLRTTVEVPAPS